MSEPGEAQEIVCAVYTHARRHPMVLGQIGGWTPPFQLTLPQVGVVVATVLLEARTWRFWGPWLPGWLALVVAIGLPCGLAWFVRWAHFEGRTLVRTTLGWVTYLYTPRDGVVNGRPHRPERTWWPGRMPVLVAPGDDR
ncbi:MAG: TcpE family conjugal transfer membrane protein [Acidimicrobiia bacterium]|jgi:hypothetical protein